jgi:hypothetical protein
MLHLSVDRIYFVNVHLRTVPFRVKCTLEIVRSELNVHFETVRSEFNVQFVRSEFNVHLRTVRSFRVIAIPPSSTVPVHGLTRA